MIPKIIHLCWFSKDPYPVEIKVCLDSWKRVLPDYEVRVWDADAARAIGCRFVDEALDERKWAFAADVVRFYAVYTCGGIYMDSDIFVLRSFDSLLARDEPFITFHEKIYPDQHVFGLQAACFMGVKGNSYCRQVLDYYMSRPFRRGDGTFNDTISPYVMKEAAMCYGYRNDDSEQLLGELAVLPTRLLAPRRRYPATADTLAVHHIYGSWRKRKLGRRIELAVKHIINLVRYRIKAR